MLRILVAGGCGFVGGNFVRHLLDTNPRITIFSLDLQAGDACRSRLADLAGDARCQFVPGDITDRALVRQLVAEGLTAIVNCAESEDESGEDSTVCQRTNLGGTEVLLEAARDYHVPRFLQVSTAEVYGGVSASGPVSEETAPVPLSAYARSKAVADRLVRGFASKHGLGAVVARCGAAYGPYQSADRPMPRLIARVLGTAEVPAPENRTGFGDWLHSADLCAALDRLWRYARPGGVYHVCGRCPRNDWDLLRTLVSAAGRSLASPWETQPTPLPRQVILDAGKIERELNWRPLIPLDRGLRHVVHWYRRNTDWATRQKRLAS